MSPSLLSPTVIRLAVSRTSRPRAAVIYRGVAFMRVGAGGIRAIGTIRGIRTATANVHQRASGASISTDRRYHRPLPLSSSPCTSSVPIPARQLSTSPLSGSKVTLSDSSLTYTVSSPSRTGTSTTHEFPYLWLRDACPPPFCTSCVDPVTTQKMHASTEWDVDVRPKSVRVVGRGEKLAPQSGSGMQGESSGQEGTHEAPEEGIRIEWPDGHVSLYTNTFLLRHASSEGLAAFHGDVVPIAWEREDLEDLEGVQSLKGDANEVIKGGKGGRKGSLFVEYDSLKSEEGLLKAIDQLCAYGLLFVRSVPGTSSTQPTAHAPGLESLTSLLLGTDPPQIRPTFYGVTWDVINKRGSADNIAYTNHPLGLHMDLLYMEHPPRWQVLWCRRNKVVGGQSVFSDGLKAAEELKAYYPSDWEVLTRARVPFQYVRVSGFAEGGVGALEGHHHLHNAHPTIELDRLTREVKYINYSPPFQAPLSLSHPPSPSLSGSSLASSSSSSSSASTPTLRQFHLALQRFASRLNSPSNTYAYTLQEGDAVVFDNRRVGHARAGFRDYKEGETEDKVMESQEEGMINRWLQGCYFEGDSMLDRGRVLRARVRARAREQDRV